MLRTITGSVAWFLSPALAATAIGIYLLASLGNGKNIEARQPALSRLNRRLKGRGTQHITRLLGQPRTVVPGVSPIWYYPVDSHQQLAMAISFRNNRAAGVEFFHPPTTYPALSAPTQSE